MNIDQAMIIFDTLSQETRLRAFRLLVNAGPEGLAAGVIGSELDKSVDLPNGPQLLFLPEQ